MATNEPTALRPPLLISARLMAAVRVADGGTIHIEPVCRDRDDRVVWRYLIEDSDGQVLDEATDLRSGTGDDIDPHQAMTTLLAFLGAAAESYRYALGGHGSENADLFPPDVTEWAYEHDDELAALAHELEQPPETAATNTTTKSGDAAMAERNARWWDAWSRTGCADCAAAAVEGRPWGPNFCWAVHRPHVPVEERTLTAGRRAQGFVSQAHLDAFFAYYDHVASCAECQRPGPPEPVDDGMQPTKMQCPTGIDLFRRALSENFKPT